MPPVGRRIARFCFTKRADGKGIGIFRGKGTRLARVWQTPRMRNARGKSVVGRHGYRGIFAGFGQGMRIFIPILREWYACPLAPCFFSGVHFVVGLYDKFLIQARQADWARPDGDGAAGVRVVPGAFLFCAASPQQFGNGPQLVNLIDNIRGPGRRTRVGVTIEACVSRLPRFPRLRPQTESYENHRSRYCIPGHRQIAVARPLGADRGRHGARARRNLHPQGRLCRPVLPIHPQRRLEPGRGHRQDRQLLHQPGGRRARRERRENRFRLFRFPVARGAAVVGPRGAWHRPPRRRQGQGRGAGRSRDGPQPVCGHRSRGHAERPREGRLA